MSRITSRCLLGMIAVALVPCTADAARRITVSAGDVDRRGSLASVERPPGVGAPLWALKSVGDGSKDHFGFAQAGPDGRLWFAVHDLEAGESRTYELVGVLADAGEVTVSPKSGGLDVAFAGRPMLRYQGDKSALPEGYDASLQRGGYLHPVVTPAGVPVTDDYPPNHKHHHGVWSPWTKTVFEGRSPDFWNMGDKKGTVEAVSFGDPWSGPVAGGFRAKHRMVDLTAPDGPKPAIDEQWDVTAYVSMGDKPAHVFDLVITQTTASDSPLTLPKYHYGGLGFRGHRQWDGKPNCRFLTSEGKTRENGNETRAKWCHVGGLVDGKPAGVAILCHPDNFRFPQPVRLHPDEPFFCFAPSQLGDWNIEPGKPYVAKYRFVVADGEPDAAEIERLWRDYAEPVKVTVE